MNLVRLRHYRERRGLTQRQLAEKAKMSYVTVNQIEQGKQDARPGTAAKLAEALSVTIEDLLGETG